MNRLAVTRSQDCDINDFRAVVEVETDAGAYPSASKISNGVPVFEAVRLRGACADESGHVSVLMELDHALSQGPGIFMIAGAFDMACIDQGTETFEEMIRQQNAADGAKGDHFGVPGANDRVWNAFEKLAYENPEVFVNYYNNDMIALGALAWLGPGYQISSQLNVVNPGGQAQVPHRDYHLGFMTNAEAEAYPLGAHLLSPRLTLQGAVAHVDMPIESGPTMYLPHSHKYELGYLAWRNEEFAQYFEHHHHQVPLSKGDVVFFNPALFHGAGANQTTSTRRMANLLQISSSMVKAMETIDREQIINSIYPALCAAEPDPEKAVGALDAVITAAADGYAFPTNLDRDQPIDGLSPPSQADLVRDALANQWDPSQLADALSAQAERRRSR